MRDEDLPKWARPYDPSEAKPEEAVPQQQDPCLGNNPPKWCGCGTPGCHAQEVPIDGVGVYALALAGVLLAIYMLNYHNPHAQTA